MKVSNNFAAFHICTTSYLLHASHRPPLALKLKRPFYESSPAAQYRSRSSELISPAGTSLKWVSLATRIFPQSSTSSIRATTLSFIN